jgi:hypothetical protein
MWQDAVVASIFYIIAEFTFMNREKSRKPQYWHGIRSEFLQPAAAE